MTGVDPRTCRRCERDHYRRTRLAGRLEGLCPDCMAAQCGGGEAP